VLTAAHCVKPESAGSIDVLGGSTELDRGGKLYPVDRVIVHEKYDAGTQDWDVALVHLSSRYDGPTIRPITAAQAREFATPGAQAVVAGWGLTAEGTDVSDILRRVNVEIQSPAACNAEAAYGGTVNGELMLCAGFAHGGKDACQGDSGGPLMVMDRSGGYLQAGIVSWGEGCARPNRFGVYTRVSAVEPWIAEHTGLRQIASPQLPRAVPVETRMRSIERNAAPPPRSGVRSNSRVELPGNVRAQAKKAKYPRSVTAERRHKHVPLTRRAAHSRAEASVDHPVSDYDSGFVPPGVIP
jgi:secreted trypsin-like serine protease